MISDAKAREAIVTELSTSFAVDAGAGTGKTTLLIDRLAAILLKEGVALPRVAAITFTDKAAGELVERLRIKLERSFDDPTLDPVLIRQALKDLEQASISTIHSFCSSIIREYPVEAKVDPRFAVLDQVQADALENQAWEGWLKKALAQEVELLSRFLKLGGSFGQIENLKDQLLKNRSLLTRPQAGSMPETQSLVREIAAFCGKIPGYLKQCKEDADPMYRNLTDLFRAWGSFADKTDPVIMANLEIPSSKSGAETRWEKGVLKPLKEEVKRLGELHGEFAGQVKNAALLSVVNWLWDYLEEYSSVKTRQGFLDFDDLLSKTRDLLRDQPLVREELKKRYDRFFVDEFQDTDPLQVEIVFFLTEKEKKKAARWQDVELEEGKLFIVGDPQQSIYRFRRADVEIYGEAKQKLMDSGGRVEKLTENFRTLSPIVDWVNQGFQKMFEGGLFPYVAQKSQRDLCGTLSPLVALELAELPAESQNADAFRKLEAETVAAFLSQLLSQTPLPLIEDPRDKKAPPRPIRAGDIAILFRDLSNTEEVYEEALRRRGVQFQVVGGKKFYNRPEIVALETLLSALESPADEASLVALLRTPLFGFSDEELFLYREQGGVFQYLHAAKGKMGEAFGKLRQWRQETREKSPSETLLYLYERTNLLAIVASQTHGEQRVANLLKVVDQCRDLETSQNFTYRAFVKWLTRQREEDSMEGEAPGPEETGNQVTLMTLHKAKGLEFPVVILSGAGKAADKPKPAEFIVNRKMGTAAFKVGSKENEYWTANYEKAQENEATQETAETLRLLYVGCTRARESLVLPRFSQEKAPAFLKPLWDSFNVKAMKSLRVTMDDGGAEVSPLVLDLDRNKTKSEAVSEKVRELERLKNEKEQRVKKRTKEPQLRSVTSVVHSDDDKAFREGFQLEGEIERPSEEAQEKAKSFGVLAHKLLEKGWDWDKALLEKAALAWAPGLNLPEEKAKEAAQMAALALAQALLQRAKKSPHVFRELPLAGKTSSGQFLNAIVDLAFLEGDEWVVVDYKTDRDMEKQKEKYREQLGYYGELLTQFTGRKVKETYLHFLKHDKVELI